MPLPPEALVLVLGPAGTQVLYVDTVRDVLGHIHEHAVTGGGPSVDRPGHGEPGSAAPTTAHSALRFYTPDGESLHLGVAVDWLALTLERSGDRVPVELLIAEVHAVLDARRGEVEAALEGSGQPVPPIPPAGTWPEQVAAMRAFAWLPGATDLDRRGWAHNLFVHRGNP